VYTAHQCQHVNELQVNTFRYITNTVHHQLVSLCCCTNKLSQYVGLQFSLLQQQLTTMHSTSRSA